jgi:hypothetical protein
MQRAKENQYTFHQPPQCKRQQRTTKERLNSRAEGNRGTQVPSPATKARGQLLAQERDIERLRAEDHTAYCQLRQDLDSGFRNELEKMKDNELGSITHQFRELESGKNRRPTASILTILQASEREIQKQFEQQMQMGNDLLQTELFDQAVRLVKNCDDTCADIKEEYHKELTVFAQCSDKNLTGIRNALLRLDTETSSVATAADGTTVDSAGSQEVGDSYESVGVPVAATTAGEDDNRIVMDGLGVSMAPGQDEGHNSVAAGTHSEVVVDGCNGISEVADAGEILWSQQVASSASVQVPPFHLEALQPASPPTIRLAIPTGSSHSSDDSELEGAQRGATTVSTPNTSTRAQEHLGLAQLGAQMTALLQEITDSTSKLTTVDQTVQTIQEQAFAVKERVTKVEKVGETTRLCAAAIDDGLAKLDKKVLILERDRDIRIEAERAFQESINEKVAVISGTHKA